MYMGRRVLRIVLLVASGIVTVAIFAVAPTILPGVPAAVHNRLTYGTFETAGAPPRVDYCGRRYYPGTRVETLVGVNEFLANNRLQGTTQVATAPSGAPVIAHVNSPEVRAQYHTSVCTMVLWVKMGDDSYRFYGLSGGP
jgi:hypothetical protein